MKSLELNPGEYTHILIYSTTWASFKWHNSHYFVKITNWWYKMSIGAIYKVLKFKIQNETNFIVGQSEINPKFKLWFWPIIFDSLIKID